MECKCNTNFIQSMGIPECGPIPGKIVKMFFTPDLTPMSLVPNVIGVPVLAESFNYQIPWIYEPGVNNTQFSLWSRVWSLVTPMIDLVESERSDAVREEIGGNSYFVKYGTRSFTCTIAKKPVEFGRLIAQLRCLKQLGVLLLDDSGILWGMRYGSNSYNNTQMQEIVRPIPVNSATIDEKMVMTTDTTVQKWQFSFQLEQTVMDYDLVPIYYDKRLLGYLPPMAIQYQIFGQTASQFQVGIFVRFAVGEREVIKHIDIPNPAAFDNVGPILPDTTNITKNGNIYTYDNIPSGTTRYRYTNSWLQNNGLNIGPFDFYSFQINL